MGDVHDPRRALPGADRSNTVDIAEQTVFVVTGLFREFADELQPSQVREEKRKGSRSP